MQLASGSHIPDGLLAANALLSEKLHQGFAAPKSTLHQGFGVSISSTPLGIIRPLYDDGTGSRSTGKERDAESGLDYFGARYYASNMGRFMSPDWSSKVEPVPYAKLDNPQSLNLYSYTKNNPMRTVDSDGHSEAVYHAVCDLAGSPWCTAALEAAETAYAAQENAQKQKAQQKKAVNKVYNETNGLRPISGKSSDADLSQARINTAHVYNNTHGRGFQGSAGLGPADARDIGKSGTDAALAYQDVKDAFNQANFEPDTTGGANHFYIYDPAALASGALKEPDWVRLGQTTTISGPFINAAGGGDVPKGDEVFVLTINDANMRNPN